jgi:ATP-dependent RNA helicase DeaD
VGTPGRVLDLIQRGALGLSHLRLLVLDEADEMLDRGFAPDVDRIVARTPTSRQTALFSATVPDWVRSTAERHLRNPTTVRVRPAGPVAPAIEHVVYEVGAGERLPALQTLLDARGAGTTLVFGRTKHGVKALCRRLTALGYPAAALQGNLSQNARDRVVAEVRAGRVPILVATNVAARGIDIAHIERVINYELPETPELFTHRVGRTGRMGRQGQAITLLAPEDLVRWRQFERSLGRSLPRRRWAAEPRADRPARPSETAGVRPAAPAPRIASGAPGRAAVPHRRPARVGGASGAAASRRLRRRRGPRAAALSR